MEKDVADINKYIGLFPSAGEAIFKNWAEPVDTPNVYRSSQPYYDGTDSVQDINEAVLEALGSKNIKSIVSLNHCPTKQSPGDLLGDGIEYLNLTLEDYSAPSVDQLKKGCELIDATHKKAQGTLVYCGAGCGRTGTMMTAYQIYITPGCTLVQLQSYIDMSTAETEGQEDALRAFYESLYP